MDCDTLFFCRRLHLPHRSVLAKGPDSGVTGFQVVPQKMESQCSGHRVKQLLTDQARELTSGEFTEYLVDNRINRRLSTPHSHQQNGVAERSI